MDAMRLAMITGLANMTPLRLDVSDLGTPDDGAIQLIVTVARMSERLSLPFELANPDSALVDALERNNFDLRSLQIVSQQNQVPQDSTASLECAELVPID